MKAHNNLFFLCENCNSPIVVSETFEKAALPNASAIHCQYCEYANTNLEGLKQYAEQSRSYAN